MPPPARAPSVPVLAPGQEALVSGILGSGPLPGGCAWRSAAIGADRIDVLFDCGGREAGLALVRSEAAGPGAAAAGPFAVVADPGAPPELVRAVAGRVGERGAELRWMTVAPDGPGRAHRPAAGIAVAGAVGLAAALALLLLARSAARALRPRLPRALLRRPRLAAPLAALGACASAHAVLLAVGLVPVASLYRSPWRFLGVAAGLALLGLYAGVAAAAILRAVASRGAAALLLAAAAAIDLGLLFPATLPPPRRPGFGGLVLPRGGSEQPEASRLRPAVTYRYNHLGFRGPDFSEAPAPGTYRVALVGDSYVFGSGVPLEGTLAVQLAGALAARDPARKVEVLNLGVPGDNVASHVDLALAAAGRLAPDAIVLCLVLPNDLSRWDVQDRYRQASRPGPYALASHLLGGDGAAFAWDLLFLERAVTPAGLAHLRRQLGRLAVLRGRPAPRLLFFRYSVAEPEVDPVLGEWPEAAIVHPPTMDAADFIPGDGHPSASGNRRFAALLAAALDAPAPATAR